LPKPAAGVSFCGWVRRRVWPKQRNTSGRELVFAKGVNLSGARPVARRYPVVFESQVGVDRADGGRAFADRGRANTLHTFTDLTHARGDA